MNPNTAKNWTLNSYTDTAWTDLVDEPSILASLSIANVSSGPVSTDIRLADSLGNSLAVIVPPFEVGANETFFINLRSIAVTGTQKLQVRAMAAGINFLASGAVESV